MTDGLLHHSNHPIIKKEALFGFNQTILNGPMPFTQGAFGWLYDLTTSIHNNNGNRRQLLKILKSAREESPAKEFSREITALAQLAGNPGIPFITWNGEVNINNIFHPAFCYNKIDPAATFNSIDGRFFVHNDICLEASAQSLFDLLLKILETIEIVHKSQIRHLDIHPNNILISSSKSIRGGEPPFHLDIWIIDFGKSAIPLKYVDDTQLSNELAEFMSPDQRSYLIQHRGRYSNIDNVLRTERSMLWDLFAIGRSFRLIGEKFQFHKHENFHKDALLKITDLLQAEDGNYERRLAQSRQLAHTWRNAAPKLNQIKVRSFVGSNAILDPALIPIIDSEPIQRLRRVQQLGLTQLLYPGATHTRFAHTLGVADITAKYIDQINSASPYKLISHKERLVSMAYALLHDIGHYPFAHYIEEIDPESLPHFAPMLHHETIGRARYIENKNLPELFSDQLHCALKNTIPGYSQDIFDETLGKAGDRTLLGQIIDGPIDADKLDYLLRDGNACGVSYANGIDIQRLLDSIREVSIDNTRLLGISAKGAASASELYYARFHMYSEVYYHKVSRFIASAIKRAFYQSFGNTPKESHKEIIQKLISNSEFGIIEWLSQTLEGNDNKRYREILEEAFGTKGRRLFKRIRTYSDIWLSTDARRNSEKNILDKLRAIGKNYKNLSILEDWICMKITETLGAKHAVNILIDVPPSKEINSFPMVMDARTTKYLNDMSAVVNMVAQAQNSSQKIRIFASRNTIDILNRKFPNSRDQELFIDDILHQGFRAWS